MTEEEKRLTQMITYVLQELCMTERVQALVDAMGYDLLKLLYYNKKLHMMACEKCRGLEENRQEYQKASRGDDAEDPFTRRVREWFESTGKLTSEDYYRLREEQGNKKEESPEWFHNLLNDMDKLDQL